MAVKSVSVATQLFRDIIIKIRKSLRGGTANPMKLSEWQHVKKKSPYFERNKYLKVVNLNFTLCILKQDSIILDILN